jgi:hypothetical protein
MDQPREIRLTDPDLVALVTERASASGRTVEDVVRDAVEALAPLASSATLSEAEIARREAWLDSWAADMRAALGSDIGSNHDWLYDENGLPK